MAHDSFGRFLQRKARYYAQEMAEDAIFAAKLAFEDFETMCSDPKADLKAIVRTDHEEISLEDLRKTTRSLSETLPRLRRGAPFSHVEAEKVINSLIKTSYDLRDAVEDYPDLEGAKDLEKSHDNLVPFATGLKALLDSHAAGIEEGLKRDPATQTESRRSGIKPTRSHSGRNCER